MSASVLQHRAIVRSNDMDHGHPNRITNLIWVLSNRKLARRKVQLIDATKWFKSLCKDLGNMREAS